jgi:hypothetical protein
VYGCTSNSIKHPESKFYMLPNRVTQPARRDRWLQAINRFDVLKRTRWSPKSDYSYVCSAHFITLTVCTDGWTAKGLASSYIGICACFFDPSTSKPKHATLNIYNLSHPHTEEAIAEVLNRSLVEWSITTDGANVVKE